MLQGIDKWGLVERLMPLFTDLQGTKALFVSLHELPDKTGKSLKTVDIRIWSKNKNSSEFYALPQGFKISLSKIDGLIARLINLRNKYLKDEDANGNSD